MTDSLQTLVLATRESGFVKRGHNCRFVGGEYNNAEHQWQCLALLYRLHPDPSKNLIWALAFHDVPERYYGDMPASVAWLNPALRKQQADAEAWTWDSLGIRFELTLDEERWLKALDRLELLMWAEDQAKMGNQHTVNLLTTVREWFRSVWGDIPKPVQDFYSNYEWKRTSETELPRSS